MTCCSLLWNSTTCWSNLSHLCFHQFEFFLCILTEEERERKRERETERQSMCMHACMCMCLRWMRRVHGKGASILQKKCWSKKSESFRKLFCKGHFLLRRAQFQLLQTLQIPSAFSSDDDSSTVWEWREQESNKIITKARTDLLRQTLKPAQLMFHKNLKTNILQVQEAQI